MICALADTSEPGKPELLPTNQDHADLVLALADGQAGLGDSATHRRGRDLLRTLWWRLAASSNRKLAFATLGLFILLGLGTATAQTPCNYQHPPTTCSPKTIV